jgi:hypothetical protein
VCALVSQRYLTHELISLRARAASGGLFGDGSEPEAAMGRRLRAAALLGAPRGRLLAVAVSGAETGSDAVSPCGTAGAIGTEAVVAPWGVPGAKALLPTTDSLTTSQTTISTRAGAGAEALASTARGVTGSEAGVSAGGAKAVACSAGAVPEAVSHARSETITSCDDCTATSTSAETDCSSDPAAGSGAVVIAASLAQLLRAVMPERGAGGERRRQVGIHLGPYHPRQAAQDGLP